MRVQCGSVPFTLKCSGLSSRACCACATSWPKDSWPTSCYINRARFLENVLWSKRKSRWSHTAHATAFRSEPCRTPSAALPSAGALAAPESRPPATYIPPLCPTSGRLPARFSTACSAGAQKYEPAAHVRGNCHSEKEFRLAHCSSRLSILSLAALLVGCESLLTTRWVQADQEARVERDCPTQARHPRARAALAEPRHEGRDGRRKRGDGWHDRRDGWEPRRSRGGRGTSQTGAREASPAALPRATAHGGSGGGTGGECTPPRATPISSSPSPVNPSGERPEGRHGVVHALQPQRLGDDLLQRARRRRIVRQGHL